VLVSCAISLRHAVRLVQIRATQYATNQSQILDVKAFHDERIGFRWILFCRVRHLQDAYPETNIIRLATTEKSNKSAILKDPPCHLIQKFPIDSFKRILVLNTNDKR
jgi:hypothetical protein